MWHVEHLVQVAQILGPITSLRAARGLQALPDLRNDSGESHARAQSTDTGSDNATLVGRVLDRRRVADGGVLAATLPGPGG